MDLLAPTMYVYIYIHIITVGVLLNTIGKQLTIVYFFAELFYITYETDHLI